MMKVFPLLSPPISRSYHFPEITFPLPLDKFKSYFNSDFHLNTFEDSLASQEPSKFIEQNEDYSEMSSPAKSNFQNEFENQAEGFFIKLVGAVPRPTLIRTLMLMIFPQGFGSFSVRKITRTPSKNLLLLIGNYLHLIQSHLSEKIMHQWMRTCYEKLNNAQRLQKNDSHVLLFIQNHIKSCSICQDTNYENR